MNEKELLKSYHNRSPFINLNHEHFEGRLLFERKTSKIYNILTLEQLDKETEKFSLLFHLMNLEDTFENYQKYMVQKEAVMFFLRINTKIINGLRLKTIKQRLEEM